MSNIENPIDVVNLSSDDAEFLVTFYIGEEEFGVDILDIHEIIRLMQITPVPNAAHYIEGVINLRGKVIPVIGLRKRLDFEEIERDSQTRIIVMEFNSKIIGFLVDAVSAVKTISHKDIEDPPPVVAGIGSEYIRGIANVNKELLILLDIEALLEEAEADLEQVQ